MDKNIEKLTKSKADFLSFVDKSYHRKNKWRENFNFPNSSFYFHQRVIKKIRASDNYKELLSKQIFLEYVYATLSTWGMDRMDGGARLVKFGDFRKSILDNKVLLTELSTYKINELDEENTPQVKEKLSVLFDSLAVMERKKRLVGVSKALHHLLPDLVPPMDGKFTLDFFYGNTNYSEKDQENKFFDMFDRFCFIARKMQLTNKDLTRDWDTSIPKLIDNAIIGFGS